MRLNEASRTTLPGRTWLLLGQGSEEARSRLITKKAAAAAASSSSSASDACRQTVSARLLLRRCLCVGGLCTGVGISIR